MGLMPEGRSSQRNATPRLLMTGGASNNSAIRQVFSDIFQRAVCCIDNAEGAAFGAAIRAIHATGLDNSDALLEKLVAMSEVRAQSNPNVASDVKVAASLYGSLEAKALQSRGRM